MLEKILEKVKTLPKPQQKLVKKLLEKFQNDPVSLFQLYAELEGYREVPVDIITFIENEKYLGSLLKGKIYPVWKDALRTIFPNPFYSPYFEVILRGAIGIGKTTIARIVLLYDIYKLLLLEAPHKKFNLIPTDRIVIALFNATLGLADQVLYEPFKELISNSEFFQDHLDPLNKKTSEIRFINNIGIVVGSRFTHTLGMAVFGALLDEANFELISSQVRESYNALLRRMESRFAQTGGKLPGHFCLVSSEKSPSDFVSQHSEKVKGKSGVVIFKYPIWEVKKHLGIYSGETFKVYIGDESTDPFIIEDPSQLKVLDPSRVIEVPIELKDKFELDIYNAIRDLAGQPLASSLRLFKNLEVLKNQATVKNPITTQIVKLSFKGNDSIVEFLDKSYLNNLPFPTSPRAIHIDLAINGDRVGIASSYLRGYKEIERIDPFTLKKEVYKLPEIIVEFVLFIEPADDRIPFYKIRQFIQDLTKFKFPVYIITTDGFQSEDMRQQLSLMGYKTSLLSVDRTKEPYYSFREAVYENRVFFPNHPILIKEFFHLEDLDKKIDHPEKFPDNTRGSKDGADAVVGSFYSILTNKQIHSFSAFQNLVEFNSSSELQDKVKSLFWGDNYDVFS